MPAKPDLSSHTLTHFLDRFVHKNPKSAAKLRGDSIMQPMARPGSSTFLASARVKAATRETVNSEAFWRSDISKVNPNEVFFHKYFNLVGQGKDQAQKKKEKRRAQKVGSDEDEDENEDEIWKALVNSRPDLEGSEPSEDDLDMDMDMDDDESASALDEGGVQWDEESADAGDVDGKSDKALFDDDDEALINSDEEVPSDLEKAFNEEVKFGGKAPTQVPEESKRSKKRRKLKNLPTFASADDYAEMLEDDQD
jgi:ribosome biogenesis protein MAK21